MHAYLILRNAKLFSAGPASFPALLVAGHAGDPPIRHVQVWFPAGLRGACAGRSKSRIWQVTTAELEPTRSMEIPQNGLLFFVRSAAKPKCGSASLFLPCFVLLRFMYHPVLQVRCGSHGATAVAFQGISFVAARPVFCACAFLCVFERHAEHNLDNCNPYFL